MADSNGKKKILFVDDDETQIILVENALKNDYQTYTAESGKEALEYLVHGLVPDLLLLDILMPGMDGWEVFHKIKAISILENVPIAFVTSVTETAEEKRAFELGADDYIKKPLDPADLLKRIKNILEKRAPKRQQE